MLKSDTNVCKEPSVESIEHHNFRITVSLFYWYTEWTRNTEQRRLLDKL